MEILRFFVGEKPKEDKTFICASRISFVFLTQREPINFRNNLCAVQKTIGTDKSQEACTFMFSAVGKNGSNLKNRILLRYTGKINLSSDSTLYSAKNKAKYKSKSKSV